MRIVSLVPSHTETLFDLGLGAEVVGRTRFCIHPDAASEVPVVGGTKDASFEKIVGLAPDVVVADKDENPLRLVQDLEEAGVEVLWSEIDDIPDAAKFIVRLGQRFGRQEEADRWATTIHDTLQDAGQEEATIPVFCPIWYDPWMTFDQTAYPHAMLAAVGFQNVYGDHEGNKYFQLTADEVAVSPAQVCLLPTEPFPFHKQRHRVDTTPLGACGSPERVMEIDGEALTWFGTRTAWGLKRLADSFRTCQQAGATLTHPHGSEPL